MKTERDIKVLIGRMSAFAMQSPNQRDALLGSAMVAILGWVVGDTPASPLPELPEEDAIRSAENYLSTKSSVRKVAEFAASASQN